jgi:hypothetical protein
MAEVPTTGDRENPFSSTEGCLALKLKAVGEHFASMRLIERPGHQTGETPRWSKGDDIQAPTARRGRGVWRTDASISVMARSKPRAISAGSGTARGQVIRPMSTDPA